MMMVKIKLNFGTNLAKSINTFGIWKMRVIYMKNCFSNASNFPPGIKIIENATELFETRKYHY